MAMKTSREGLIEIASHEGIVTSPYRDSVGIWTVGIGHTASAGAPDPAKNRRDYSIDEIMEIFARDIARFENRVNAAFKVKPTQAQFDAAVSFDYNTGGINRAGWLKDFNAGNASAARRAFMRWCKPPQIIPRRQKECDLFFEGRYSSAGKANLYPALNGKVHWAQGRQVDIAALLNEAFPPPAVTRDAPTVKPSSHKSPGETLPAKPKHQWRRLLEIFALIFNILFGKRS